MKNHFELYKAGWPVKLVMNRKVFIDGIQLKRGEVFPIVYMYGSKPVISHKELGEVYLEKGEWRLKK